MDLIDVESTSMIFKNFYLNDEFYLKEKWEINSFSLILSYMKLNFTLYFITIFIYVIFTAFSLLYIYFRYFLRYAFIFLKKTIVRFFIQYRYTP